MDHLHDRIWATRFGNNRPSVGHAIHRERLSAFISVNIVLNRLQTIDVRWSNSLTSRRTSGGASIGSRPEIGTETEQMRAGGETLASRTASYAISKRSLPYFLYYLMYEANRQKVSVCLFPAVHSPGKSTIHISRTQYSDVHLVG